jgi:DAHP synthase ferredoxin-like domain
MVDVLNPGSQPDEVARLLHTMERFGFREHPAEAGQGTIIGAIGEKVAVALGREVQWL